MQINDYENPNTSLKIFKDKIPLKLECQITLSNINIAYQVFGSNKKNNAILICHHLTGDTQATKDEKISDYTPGWWQDLIGPGRVLDTNRYFIICSNVLGGCSGSTGPRSINIATQRSYNMNFPLITIRDMVNMQYRLMQYLEVEQIIAVIGPSMGGMQAFEWSVMYPEYILKSIILAAFPIQTSWAIGWNEISRLSIMNDPAWCNGNYQEQPIESLALARYPLLLLCKDYCKTYFERNFSLDKIPHNIIGSSFKIQNYLHRQSNQELLKMDANSYLYLLNAINMHDISRGRGTLEDVLKSIKIPMILMGVSSDLLYPAETIKSYANKIPQAKYFEILATTGHDAVLTEQLQIANFLSEML